MPTLDSDSIFGAAYLSVTDFSARTSLFGVKVALPSTDLDILSYLSSASIYVETITGKTFDPTDVHDEQHAWDPDSRRIFPYNPPVSSVSVYEIFTGANVKASFDPTTALYINESAGWIELSALSVVGPSSALLLTGITTPIVHIVYKSFTDVPDHIALATGYVAGAMMNSSFLNANAPAGIKDVSIGSMSKLSMDTKLRAAGVVIPGIVGTLLAQETVIGVS